MTNRENETRDDTDDPSYHAERRLDTARNGIVSAIFDDGQAAEKAFRAASERGYDDEEINVLMSEQARDEYFPSEKVEVESKNKTLEGTGVGSAVGATVGAIAAVIAGIGTTLALPGLGLVVAGPVAGALAGAGAGGVAGGLVGALVGAGMSEERAHVYKTAIEEGGIVLAVEPRNEDDAEALAETWDEVGGREVHRS